MTFSAPARKLAKKIIIQVMFILYVAKINNIIKVENR